MLDIELTGASAVVVTSLQTTTNIQLIGGSAVVPLVKAVTANIRFGSGSVVVVISLANQPVNTESDGSFFLVF